MLALRLAARRLVQRPATSPVVLRRWLASSRSPPYSVKPSWQKVKQQNATSTPSNGYSKQPSRAVRIQNLPLETTEQELEELMSKYGKILAIRMRPPLDGATMKRASVLFEDAHDTDRLMQAHQQQDIQIHGKDLALQYGSLTDLKPACDVVFVGGLSLDTTEEDLRELVKLYLVPKEIRLGTGRDFAHIECRSVEDAMTLIQVHEDYPFRNKAGQLLRMNYDTQKEPWRSLCVFGFEGSSRDLEEICEARGCEGIVEVTSYRKEGTVQEPLYFIRCESIPAATKIKQTLKGTLEPLGFRIDYANIPRRELDKRAKRHHFEAASS